MKLPREFEFKRRNDTALDFHDNLNIWWLYYHKQSTGWHIRFNGRKYSYNIPNSPMRLYYNLKVAQIGMVEDFSKQFNLKVGD